MIAPRRTLTVLAPDPALARELPKRSCIKRVSDPSEDPSRFSSYVFVLVALLELPTVASFVREANQRHHLRGLLVRDETRSQLLPQILQRANLRAVNTLLVHSDPGVPSRVLRAYCIGAEDHLIADARLYHGRLFLISCAGEAMEVPMDLHPALRRIPEKARGRFSVASDGAYVHWPESDIHLDLEDARIFNDPREMESVKARRAQADKRFGQALSRLRRQNGLRQTDVPGLSERQIRRYERGAYVPVGSLRLLAQAHRMGVEDYLDKLGEEAGRRGASVGAK